MKRPSVGLALATLAGVGASAVLLRETEWIHLRGAWTRLSPVHWGVGFAAYVAFVGVKSIRYSVLLGGGFNRRHLFGIVAAQTFWSNALPLRAGDLSYVLMMHRRADVPPTRGVASLLVASFLDLWTLLALGAVVGFAAAAGTGRVLSLFCLVGVAGGAFALVGAHRIAIGKRYISALEGVPLLGRHVRRLADELERVTWDRPFLCGVVWSLVSLGARFAFQLYLLKAMFPGIRLSQGLFALTFTGLINLLPIQGVANVGSIELPWTWALTLVSVSTGEAVTSGFALHAVVLVYSIGVGALSLALLGRSKRDGT